jgi:hypothetical protein
LVVDVVVKVLCVVASIVIFIDAFVVFVGCIVVGFIVGIFVVFIDCSIVGIPVAVVIMGWVMMMLYHSCWQWAVRGNVRIMGIIADGSVIVGEGERVAGGRCVIVRVKERVVIIVNVVGVVEKFDTKSISEGQVARHALGTPECGHAVHDVSRGGELSPMGTTQEATGGKA